MCHVWYAMALLFVLKKETFRIKILYGAIKSFFLLTKTPGSTKDEE